MKYYATALISFISFICSAQSGYEIKVTLKPFTNQYIYLGHYNGKQLPIVDSVKLNEKSEAIFKGSKKLGGGIYLIGFPDRSQILEFLVDKNQHFSIVADTSQLSKLSFINSPDNVAFKAYQDFMVQKGKSIEGLVSNRNEAATEVEKQKITNHIDALSAEIKKYRSEIISKEPNSFLTTLLLAMREPEVPHNDPSAKGDSLFAYKYFKKHYWDGVYFFDDRLTRTPFFESRVDKYYDQLVYPSADSVIKEIDWMMGYASASEEMQKFLLLKFVNRYLHQKFMWEDAVFVHLYEKYFASKDYSWLTPNGKKTITDRAYSLMANILGNPSPEVELPDTTGKRIRLYSVEAPYTVVAIWDPKCGYCKEVLPKLDSIYRSKWKATGLKMFALAKETEGKRSDWTSYINELKISDWINVYYSKEEEQKRISSNMPGYSQLFDVQSFPTLYLLDKEKRIIAKKLTYKQIDDILEQRLKANKSQ